METKEEAIRHSKIFFIVSFTILILVSVYLVRSYIVPLLSAMVIAYIFYPLYRKVERRVHNRTLAALLMAIAIVLVITIPLLFLANTVVNESVKFFYEFNNLDLGKVADRISQVVGENIDVNYYLKEIISKFSLFIAKTTSGFILSLPAKILSIFVTLFALVYLLKDGEQWIQELKRRLPLRQSYKEELTKRVQNVMYATLYGIVVTAIIQGSIGALGLWIFGVPSPLLWGVVMIILAMIPFVGPFVIWFPAALIKLTIGETFNGIGLMLYGLLIVSTIDNLIRPKIIGLRGRIHPVIVLLGVLGGIQVFGLIGMILGPLILAITLVFLEFYLLEHEYHA